MMLPTFSNRFNSGVRPSRAVAAHNGNDLGLDSALARLSALQKGKKPSKSPNSSDEKKTPTSKAASHATPQKPSAEKPMGKPIKAQNQINSTSQPPNKKKKTKSGVLDDDDDDDIDMEKIWSQVDAAIARKDKMKSKITVNESEGEIMVPSSSPSPPSSSSSGFKGFGIPPPLAKKASSPSSSATTNRPAPKSGAFKIFLHSTEEAVARQAIVDAGLSSKVEIDLDVTQCQAVVCAKLTRQGKQVKLQQGERTAANHNLPFICVGRNLTGPSLRAALKPLLYPTSTFDEGKRGGKDEELTREAARAAVRAVRSSGAMFFPPPPSSPSPASPISQTAVQDVTVPSSSDKIEDDEEEDQGEEEDQDEDEGEEGELALASPRGTRRIALTRSRPKLRLQTNR